MKGLVMKTTGELILMIIVVIVLAAASVSALPYIKNLLAQYFGLYSNTAFAEAVQCAYVRCESDKGCGDRSIQNGAVVGGPWANLRGGTCPCNPAFQDPNGKICGFEAKQYPVEVTQHDQTPITRNSFSTSLDCIYAGQKQDLGNTWKFGYTFKILTLDDSLIRTNPGTPDSCTSGFSDGITNFVPSGNIYVYTDDPNEWATLTDVEYDIYAKDSPSYAVLSTDKDSRREIQRDKTYQIAAKDQRFAVSVTGAGPLGCYKLRIQDLSSGDKVDTECGDLAINQPYPIQVGKTTLIVTDRGFNGATFTTTFDFRYSTTQTGGKTATRITISDVTPFGDITTTVLSGKLTDLSGQPISNKQVEFTWTDASGYFCLSKPSLPQTYTATTGTDGTYKITIYIRTCITNGFVVFPADDTYTTSCATFGDGICPSTSSS